MDSPISIIIEMITVVFTNTFGTLGQVGGLFGNLTQSLSFVSSTGPLGFGVAVIVFAIVLFLLAKFFISSWKILAFLFVIGVLILWALASFA